MNNEARRKWMFSVEDWDGRMHYIDTAGNEIDEDMAKTSSFVGTDREALRESETRADRWEDITGYLVAKVTRHSLGIVE